MGAVGVMIRRVRGEKTLRCRSFRAMMWSSRSRRQLPTRRSATPFFQGLWIEVSPAVICRERRAAGTSRPYFWSLSKSRNLGADS